jgi:hypothetical protein
MKKRESSKFSEAAKEQIRASALAHGGRRHDAVVMKVTKIMRTIEQEIEANQGLYPSNGGALNLSELARRSGIGEKTLFAASYKDTFKSRVVDPWLLKIKGGETASKRDAKRSAAQRVSEWRELYGDLLTAYRISELDWQEARRLRAEAEERVLQLTAENYELHRKINQLTKGTVTAFPPGVAKSKR